MCKNISKLDDKEIILLRKDFDDLSVLAKKSDIDNIKDKNIFPGLADIKEKPDDPYGDFIIFHEIIKFIRTKTQDVIFLTFDNSKGDWMKKNRSPHLHYIENVYRNTDKILYIIDAERTLNQILEVNIESLIKGDSTIISETLLTSESIDLIFEEVYFEDFTSITSNKSNIINELELNGYLNLPDVLNDIRKINFDDFKHFINSIKFRPAKLGALRLILMIINPNYQKFNINNKISAPSPYFVSLVNRFRKTYNITNDDII